MLDGRDALTPVFDDLNRYQATMHFNGQTTISLDGCVDWTETRPSHP